MQKRTCDSKGNQQFSGYNGETAVFGSLSATAYTRSADISENSILSSLETLEYTVVKSSFSTYLKGYLIHITPIIYNSLRFK